MSDAAQSPNDLDDVEGHRISGNDNETIVEDDQDVEGHRIAGNDNETIVEDDQDVEGHRLASNDNETIVEDETTRTSRATGWPRTITRRSSKTRTDES